MTKLGLTVKFQQEDHKIVAKERLHDGFFKIDCYSVKHKLFNGGETEVFQREIFERGEASAVLLYDPIKNVVILTEQYRVGAAFDGETSPWILEVVAGMIEEGEDPEGVACREAEEEAGAVIRDLIPITNYWSSPGGTSEKVHLFCALVDSTHIGGVHGLQGEHEDILVRKVPFNQAYDAIATGEINNAATIIALQWLKLHQDSIR